MKRVVFFNVGAKAKEMVEKVRGVVENAIQACYLYQLNRHQAVTSSKTVEQYRSVNQVCLEQLRVASGLLSDACREVCDLCLLMISSPMRDRLMRNQYGARKSLDLFLNRASERVGWRELPAATLSCMREKQREHQGDCLQDWARVIEVMEMLESTLGAPTAPKAVRVEERDSD